MADEITPLDGQGEGTPIEEQPANYFEWTDPDTKEVSNFATREDLEKGFKDSYMMRSDYTRKTQDIATQRRQNDSQRQRLDSMMEDVRKKQTEYEKFDDFIKNRPDVYRQLNTMMQAPPDGNVGYERATSYVDEKNAELDERLKEFENWKRESELEKEKNLHFEELRTAYPDFDSEAVEKALQSLGQGNIKDLYESLYFSGKGRDPVALEQRAARAAKEKAEAGVLPAGSQSKSTSKHNSLEDVTADLYDTDIL